MDLSSVVAGFERAALDAAEIVDEHIVILNAAFSVGRDAFEDFSDLIRFDFKAGLFEDFAFEGVDDAFADFDQATGERPVAEEGRFATTAEEDAGAIQDEGSDAKQRACGILPARSYGWAPLNGMRMR